MAGKKCYWPLSFPNIQHIAELSEGETEHGAASPRLLR